MALSDIRTLLDSALGTITGLEHFKQVPPVFNPPVAFTSLNPQRPVSYDLTAGNASMVYHFYIEVLVNKAVNIEQAQDDLDQYLHFTGNTSIKTAIESIGAPNTAFDVLRVIDVSNFGPVKYGNAEFLGARLMVDIWTTV